MNAQYDEYSRRVELWKAAGDSERLQLTNHFHAGFACHETDTDRSFALFTRGRDEASHLQEPWWVLFFECWRLISLTSHSMDFTRALPLAMQLMVQINSPANLGHDWRNTVLTEVLHTYLSIDPAAYREEIERGFAFLDREASSESRYILNQRRTTYFMNLEQWDQAYDLGLRSLAEANRAADPSQRTWHGAWVLLQLCRICDALGKTDLLACHAEHMGELSVRHLQLQRTQAAALCWRAVTDRLLGNGKNAATFFHKGLRLLARLIRRDTICADPIARYYELGEEFQAAVKVRERELAEVVQRGRLHRACQVQVERCRLLARMNELTPADLDAARQSAARLRVPDWFLSKLDLISGRGNAL
jgi:hypothetical protein